MHLAQTQLGVDLSFAEELLPELLFPRLCARFVGAGDVRHLVPDDRRQNMAERPGQVVSREHLIAEVWADTFVTDDVLKRSISELRKALGDDSRQPTYIETIPKGGYRLVAPVRANTSTPPQKVVSQGRPWAGLADGEGTTATQANVGKLTSRSSRPKLRLILASSLVAGTLVAAWWATRDRSPATAGARPSAAAPRNLARLTHGPGLQTDAAWSPDGRFIAYASDRSGQFDIWVRPVTGGDPVQITRSPANDTQPDWAPDGSRIVFRSERDGGGLFVVPALGGIERKLTSFGTHPTWTPDSQEILFVDGTAPGEGESWLRLYAVSPEEGAPRELLSGSSSRELGTGLRPILMVASRHWELTRRSVPASTRSCVTAPRSSGRNSRRQ